MVATPDAFDCEPMTLNTENSIVDLRTGDQRDHDPAELHRQIAGAKYDPTATAPRWLKFLEEILPDPEVRGSSRGSPATR
jgi:putative DNA primase/helicase